MQVETNDHSVWLTYCTNKATICCYAKAPNALQIKRRIHGTQPSLWSLIFRCLYYVELCFDADFRFKFASTSESNPGDRVYPDFCHPNELIGLLPAVAVGILCMWSVETWKDAY